MATERARFAAFALTLSIVTLAAPGPRAQELGGEPQRHTLVDDRPSPSGGEFGDVEIDLQKRLKDVPVFERNGRMFVRVESGDRVREVPAEEWLRALHDAEEEQRQRGFFYALFNITKPWGFLWITVGFLGQALFTLRMVLQWWASEKEKRSVVPVAFWWGSLFGGLLLFVYFCWRKDIVGIVGQSTGIFVYARNLALIHRVRRETARAHPHPDTA